MIFPGKGKNWILVALVVLTTALAACGGTETAPEPTATLAGTSWKLLSLNDKEVVSGTVVTASFYKSGQLAGSMGCNFYSATYVVEGDAISTSALVPTNMQCAEPQGVMEQEEVYLAFLQNAARYEVQNDQLQIRTSDGSVVATFSPAPPRSLQGTNWTLWAYNDAQGALLNPLSGTEITAVFGKDENLSGSAGCNTYNAGYQADDSTISIGPAMSTLMACVEPDGIMEQEAAYLGSLESLASYEIFASWLVFSNAEGKRVLIFATFD